MRSTIATACAILLGVPAGGLSAQTTLQEALVRAYENNPTLLADREGLKILDEDVATAYSAGRPSLVAEGNVTRSELDVVGSGGIIGARLSQPLYRGGRVVNNVGAAKANVAAGRQSLRQSEADILLGVVEAYSAARRDIAVLEQNLALSRILDQIRGAEGRRLELGERTRTDLSQAEARFFSIEASVTAAQRRLVESQARYRSLVGTEPDNLAPLPPPPAVPASVDEVLNVAWAEHPRVLQARAAEEVASYQVKAAEGALLPSVDASVGVNHRDEIVQILNRKLRQDLATFQLVFTVPLYQGGAEYAAVRRAKHTKSLRIREIEENMAAVTAEAQVAWRRHESAKVAEAAFARAIAANEAAVEGVRREAFAGSRTTLDVLNAERELRDARISLLSAQHERFVTAYQLLAAMGRLSVTSLGLPVDSYNPDVHYRKSATQWFGLGEGRP